MNWVEEDELIVVIPATVWDGGVSPWDDGETVWDNVSLQTWVEEAELI